MDLRIGSPRERRHDNFLTLVRDLRERLLKSLSREKTIRPWLGTGALPDYLWDSRVAFVAYGGNFTIGQLTSLYRNLLRRGDRMAIAKSIGLTSPVLESWMLTYTALGNIFSTPWAIMERWFRCHPMILTSPKISWLVGKDALPFLDPESVHTPGLGILQSVPDTISPL